MPDCPDPAAGINTGPCITGDADCDGDAGASTSLGIKGTDNARLDKGEFLIFVLYYGDIGDFTNRDPEHNVVFGKPAGQTLGSESLDTIRVARYTTPTSDPRNSFGTTMANIPITYFNAPDGPDPTHKHMEIMIEQYSTIPEALGLTWDRDVGAVGYLVNIGSIDDGPIGEDTFAAQNFPSPSTSPSPSETPSPSESPSNTESTTESPTSSESPSATVSLPPPSQTPSPTPSTTCPPPANSMPKFTVKLDKNVYDSIDASICVGKFEEGNLGVVSITIETSRDGVTWTKAYSMTRPSVKNCPAAWKYEPAAGACVPRGTKNPCSTAELVPKSTKWYRYIRGSVVGRQYGELCAFGRAKKGAKLESRCLCTDTSACKHAHWHILLATHTARTPPPHQQHPLE